MSRKLTGESVRRLGKTKPVKAPNLHEYAWVVINSSGGKDSQTSLDLMMEEVMIQNYPVSQVVVSHQDLGEMEWPGTTDLAREQAEAYGLRFEISRYRNRKKKELTLLDYVLQRGMWPSSDARYCTSDFKRGPGNRILTKLRQERPGHILQTFGFRAEESPSRKKKKTFAINTRASGVKYKVYDFLNIHHWTLSQVWENIRQSGIKHHWAYDIGMPRLSCAFCVIAPEAAIALAARYLPDLFQKYLDVEEKTGHTFTSKFSLKTIDQKIKKGSYGETLEVTNWKM